MNGKKEVLEYNLSLSPLISDLIDPLNKHFQINKFSYLKLYEDKIFIISNDNNWMQHYLANDLHDLDHYQNEISNIANDNSYMVIRSNDHHISNILKEYNICNEISFYKQYSEYIEMWNFATSKDDKSIINFYINNIAIFERFIIYFQNKTKHILADSEQKLLLIRKQNLKFNNKSLSNNISDFFSSVSLKKFNSLINNDYLTNREAECLYLISLGKTSKEIAKLLNSSPRTIETHINNTKIKLSCSYKSELIDLSFKMKLKEYFGPESYYS